LPCDEFSRNKLTKPVKEQTERECRLDGNIGVNRLSASLADHWCSPGRDSLWTDPQRDVAAIA
jgi:hypothetical protein